MLTGAKSVCARCHKAGSDGAKAAAEIAQLLAGLEAAGPGSKEALARARLAVHTLDVAAVKQQPSRPQCRRRTKTKIESNGLPQLKTSNAKPPERKYESDEST